MLILVILAFIIILINLVVIKGGDPMYEFIESDPEFESERLYIYRVKSEEDVNDYNQLLRSGSNRNVYASEIDITDPVRIYFLGRDKVTGVAICGIGFAISTWIELYDGIKGNRLETYSHITSLRYRRKGYMNEIHSQLLSYIKSIGINTVWASVLRTNSANRSALEKLGYRMVAEKRGKSSVIYKLDAPQNKGKKVNNKYVHPAKWQTDFLDSRYESDDSGFVEVDSRDMNTKAFADYSDILINHSEGNLYKPNPANFWNKRVFVMYRGDAAVGVVVISLTNWICSDREWLFETTTVVHGDYRRQGLSVELKRFAFRLLYEAGIHTIYLVTKVANTANIAAVEKMGYTVYCQAGNNEIAYKKEITKADI